MHYNSTGAEGCTARLKEAMKTLRHVFGHSKLLCLDGGILFVSLLWAHVAKGDISAGAMNSYFFSQHILSHTSTFTETKIRIELDLQYCVSKLHLQVLIKDAQLKTT